MTSMFVLDKQICSGASKMTRKNKLPIDTKRTHESARYVNKWLLLSHCKSKIHQHTTAIESICATLLQMNDIALMSATQKAVVEHLQAN